MTTDIDKKRITSMALAIYNANRSLSWSDCMKRAWDFHWFRKMLTNGIVHFRYFKRDPDITVPSSPLAYVLREARGTLVMSAIPEDKRPKGTSTRKPNFDTISYYDLDRADWRSFKIVWFDCIVRYIPK